MALKSRQPLGFWRTDPSVGSRFANTTGQPTSNIGSIADILSEGNSKIDDLSYGNVVKQISAALPEQPLDVGKLAQALDIEPSTLADVLHKAALNGDIKLDKDQNGSILVSRP